MAVAKRTAKKKAAKKKTSRGQTITIKYRCVSGKCRAQPKFAHLKKKGNTVAMMAINTGVTIEFPAGSPFNTKKITIAEGKTVKKAVVNAGKFEYDLTCSKCATLAIPPQMIVP